MGAYAQREILAPLGMTNSAWSLAGIKQDHHSRLYVSQDGLTIPIPLYEATTYPDGGVRTSVNDLSRFFIVLLGGGESGPARILKQETVAEMQRFQFTAASKPDKVDLKETNSGLFWATKYNVTKIGHNGSDPGVRAEMLSDLSKDVAVILLANTSLSGEDMRHPNAIFLALWKHAEAMQKAKEVAAQ